VSKNKIIVSTALATVIGLILYVGFTWAPSPVTSALAQDSSSDAKKKASGDAAKKNDAKSSKKKKRSRRNTFVQVDEVRTAPMVQTIPLVGRLIAVRSGMVAARLDAPVAQMRVDVGDHVKKGDVLALLANDRFRWDREQKVAELAGAKAAVETAKARLALAQQELKRYADLKNSAAFPKARFQDKKLEVNRLRNEINESKAKAAKSHASLKMAETELSYTKIIAPYDGTITRRQSEMGAFIKEGQAMFTMMSDGNLEIEVDVPAHRVAGLKPGMVCVFTLSNDKGKFEAVIRAIVPEEDLRTRTRTVRFTPRFKTPPSSMAANQSVTVALPVGKGRSVLSVHKDALVSSRGQPTVYVVEDGRARAQAVKLGEAVGVRFEVLEGLKEGDKVVTRGNERLRDGRRVKISKVATQ
jgi:RND family efflux transporter MFP subunit